MVSWRVRDATRRTSPAAIAPRKPIGPPTSLSRVQRLGCGLNRLKTRHHGHPKLTSLLTNVNTEVSDPRTLGHTLVADDDGVHPKR